MNAEKCVGCGLCRANCPIFKNMLIETASPRGKATLINEKILDDIFYKCTLCKACKIECPLGLDLEFEKLRGMLVEHHIETDANKKMIKNVRQYGNPFGKIDKDKVPKELYCC